MNAKSEVAQKARNSPFEFAWPVVLLVVCVATGIFLFKPIISLPVLSPKDFNEGYHAYFSLSAFSPEGLYPSRSGLIANGYTPLFFYLAGALGAVLGDHIIAGRVMALLGFVVASIGIGLIVQSVTACRPVAVFSAIFFAGFMALHHPSYVAMNDPQWVAQAFVVSALYVFVRRGETTAGLLAVVLLVLAAGLTKQTVIALPLAITLYMVAIQRQQAVAWLLWSSAALMICLGGLYLVYGREFFTAVLLLDTDMEFSYSRILGNIRTLAKPLGILLASMIVFVALEPPGPRKMLLLAYAGLAAIVGFFLTGGAGVDWNHLYDLVIALVILMGLAIFRIGERLARKFPEHAAGAIAALIVSLSLIVAVPARFAEAKAAASDLEAREARVSKVVAVLAAQEGPVLCETMALCYWAGKPHDADILVLRRKLLSGAMSDEEFRRLIDSGHFRMLQFHSGGSGGRTKRLPQAANDYILQVYENRPNEMGGSLLTPRGSRSAR